MTVDPATKEKVFALLRARGATKAVLNYNGGNDEGGVDDITLFLPLASGEMHEVALQTQWSATGDDKVLAELLEAPVDAKYGSWAGEFSAYGSLVWDAEAGTVVMNDYLQEEYTHSQESW